MSLTCLPWLLLSSLSLSAAPQPARVGDRIENFRARD
jgi:hypothetical protein